MPADAPESRNLPLPRRGRSNTRYNHLIRPNHSGEAPQNRVYVDTEAYIEPQPNGDQRQTLWFGWACFERSRPDLRTADTTEHWLRFEDAAAFWDALESFAKEKTATYIYAHNWFYDLAMISAATEARLRGWTITEYVPASHLLWLSMRKGTKSLHFIDTLNYFAMSLEKLGEDIGEYKSVSTAYPQSSPWWDDYCKQDVTVIRHAMHQYFSVISELDFGMYRKTLASQAYGAWRHRFMHHDVLILNDPQIEALERSAYHGGRSEVFYDLPIHSPVYGLDVNSMYPWVMREYLFPAIKAAKGRRMSLPQLRERISSELVVARVTVQTDEPVYPYASVDRVIYPVGQFETSLSTPELAYALAHDHLLSCSEWVSYEPAPLFREFVDELYPLRSQYRTDGNLAFAFLVKILLNSLYGKFGQRGFVWKRCEECDSAPYDEFDGNCEVDGPILKHRRRFGEMWHRLRDLEAFESFPAIAAHVTAYARMALWQLKSEAGHENVYYCDTDSLYTNTVGKERLSARMSETELGGLKLESESRYAWFRAPKDYELDDYRKIKGVRKSARQVSDTVYEQVQFESYDQTLSHGQDGVIVVKSVQKRLSRLNRQSRGTGVGWRQPYQIDEAPGTLHRLPWQFQPTTRLEL